MHLWEEHQAVSVFKVSSVPPSEIRKSPPPSAFCQEFSLKILYSGSPEDMHSWHSFPDNSAAEEYNAISLKSWDDPYLKSSLKQEK